MTDVSGRNLTDLPKVHVHVHLDGSYPVEAVRDLASRQGGTFEAPRGFDSVSEFFQSYGTVPDLVQTPEDLASLCTALVVAEAAEGVLFLEPAIEPQLYAPRLGNLLDVTKLIVDALQAAAVGTGMQVGANLTVNTDEDEAIAEELATVAAEFAGRGITAFGTAGFVEPAGLQRFAGAAEIAHRAGLQVVSHAGQTGGPESIREALDVIGATRISHGFTAGEDSTLVDRLVAEQIVCDVCPVSNVALGLVATMSDHPVRGLIAAGAPVTLNADDSLWFGFGVTYQYQLARELWGFDDSALADVARTGLLIPGLSTATRTRFADALTQWELRST